MSVAERRARRLAVDALLAELDGQRRELYRRKAWGVRRAGLRDLVLDHEATQLELALVVAT
ncbi:MAG TPA: hypothetical protein VGC78_11130 [Gaiellaceae bacterium]|jgi:hypothetical protein